MRDLPAEHVGLTWPGLPGGLARTSADRVVHEGEGLAYRRPCPPGPGSKTVRGSLHRGGRHPRVWLGWWRRLRSGPRQSCEHAGSTELARPQARQDRAVWMTEPDVGGGAGPVPRLGAAGPGGRPGTAGLADGASAGLLTAGRASADGRAGDVRPVAQARASRRRHVPASVMSAGGPGGPGSGRISGRRRRQAQPPFQADRRPQRDPYSRSGGEEGPQHAAIHRYSFLIRGGRRYECAAPDADVDVVPAFLASLAVRAREHIPRLAKWVTPEVRRGSSGCLW
jgi:hypothetical protein